MATQLFLVTSGQSNTDADTHRGTNTAKLNGSANGWLPKPLSLTRGGSGGVSSTSTVAGPTNGVECQNTTGGFPLEFISPPVAADVTISGTITANLWAREASMTDNVAINVVVDIIRATDNSIVQIVKSSFVTELGTGIALNGFTTGMTSGAYTAQTVNRGDRIRIRVFGDDVGTMGGGSSFVFDYAGNTASADGDSYVEFTENFAFEVAGTVLATGGVAGTTGQGFGDTTNPQAAQSFTTPAGTSAITRVTFNLAKVGSPTDNLICELRSDDGTGKPSATVLATATALPMSSLAVTFAQFSFSLPVAVSPLTTYHVVLSRSGATNNSNYVSLEVSGSYTGGSFFLLLGGTTWTAQSSDTSFTVYGTGTGDTIYLTDTASDVVTASVDKEAWTSRGGGVSSIITNTVNGFTSPIQMTDSAGGTVVDWFTKPLQAFTLGGLAKANIRALESNASANVSLRMEIARVNGDGTSPTVWGSWCVAPAGTDAGEITVGEDVRTANVSGDNLAFTDGQRIRIRIYLDDLSTTAMASGFTATLRYGGSALGSGDTYVTFPVLLTEFITGITYTDSATVLVDLQASGTEFPAKEYADSPTVSLVLQVSSVEWRVPGDTSIPAFRVASVGDVMLSGTKDTNPIVALAADELIILHVMQGAKTASGVTLDSSVNLKKLDGTTGMLKFASIREIGTTPGTRWHHFWIGRSVAAGPCYATMSTTGDDIFRIMYSFLYTGSGTTEAAVYENSVAGGSTQSGGTSATAGDSSITTLGSNRLALNFEAVADDNVCEVFTGQTNGTWVLENQYIESGGVQGTLALQTARVPSPVNINGGTGSVTASADWGTVGFALIGLGITTDAAVVPIAITITAIDIREIPDSGTVPVVMAVASVETKEIPDAATVLVDIQTSGTEFQSKEYSDTDIALVDIQASGTEFQSREYSDSATAPIVLMPTSVEAAQFVDAATPLIDIQVSSVEAADYADSATPYIDLQSSGTEVREITDATTVLVDIQTSGVELREITDTDIVLVDLQASGTDQLVTFVATAPYIRQPLIVGSITYQDRSRW